MATKKKRARVSMPEDFPEFGAIFMANRATMEECLERRLFGLPSSQQGFVRGVRVGMVLFLFEYEERLLYGVFEATSNGGFNVFPRAYGSRFPAQVRFSKIWDCDPICEDDFRYAIEENYYERFKFRFGLSQRQVNSLLLLFDTKRTEVSTIRSLSCEREYINGTGCEDSEIERSAFWRKQPKSNLSDQTVNDKASGLLSGVSGNSISSFESQSGPNDFGAGVGATIFKEEPEKRKDSSKDPAGDLEDFIPLPSPDNSDNEMEFSKKSPMESVAFEQYFPMKLIACKDPEERTRGSLQVDDSLKLNVIDNKGDRPCIKGLYSDDQENRSVFSRLKFGLKDIGQENCKNFREDRLVRESKGNSQRKHGNKETTVFSRFSQTSKVMKDINDSLKLQIGNGQHNKKMEETNFVRENGQGYNEMRSLPCECNGVIKEEKTRGNGSVQDVMDSLLQRHSAWRKISDHKTFEKEDAEPTVKKNVFARLSWASRSIHQETIVTVGLQKGNGMGTKRVRSPGFHPQYRNCKYTSNNFADRWPDTLSWEKTRESEVPNQKYEAEEKMRAHISIILKGETQIEEGECVNDSESKYKSEQPTRRKLVRPLFNHSSEVKTHTSDSHLNVQIPSGESFTDEQHTRSIEASAEGNLTGEKMACLEKEAQIVFDPLNCKSDEGGDDCNFVSKVLNSGELLVGCSNPADHAVTMPLKTYKRRAKKV